MYTEVALLAMRKKSARVMGEILNNPEAIDAVMMLIEKGGYAPDRVHAKVQAAVFMAFAQYTQDERDESMQKQIDELTSPVSRKK